MARVDSMKLKKNKNRNRSKEQHDSEIMKNSSSPRTEGIVPKENEERKKLTNKTKVVLKRHKDDTDQTETHGSGEKKKRLLKNKKKLQNDGFSEEGTDIFEQPNEIEGGFGQQDSDGNEIKESKKGKSRRKKRKSENVEVDGGANEIEGNQKGKSRKKIKSEKKVEADSDANEVEENQKGKSRKKKRKTQKKTETNGVNISEQRNGKSRKTDSPRPNAEENFQGKSEEAEEVYELSSGDEDTSKGMRKWIAEYHQSRPGLQVLQEKIDEYIVAYEAEKEQERKEKAAHLAEDGWTVVVHHKGRKKTTDSETGMAVGSVSQAAVMENMAKKKTKETGLDFYRFQKREAKINEIMELQSKFEQDKKRAQQLRAARKFRPL